MKAKSRFLTAALAFCLIFSLAAVALSAFSDVSGHWAQAQIEKWVDKGLAKSYPDGTFKPDNQVTRAEFVTLLNRAWSNQNPDARCDFTDVKASDWYFAEVAAAAEAGYVSGYEDKTFRPDNPISRVEAGAIIARLLKLPAGSESVLDAFKDAAVIGAWAKGSISALVAEKLLGGYPDGTFKPVDPITRAEAIVLLDRALAYSGKEGEVVPVTGVKLNKDKLSLRVGSTAQLEAIIEPANATNKNVTWSSNDESIATVDQAGKVKGIKKCKATITVTTEDGNKTAACEVNVYRSGGGGGGGGGSTAVSVTGVSLDQATLNLTVGGSVQLTATVSPENATNKSVTWSSSDPAVATVDSTGKVTAVAPGEATITVTTVDGSKTASCAVTVTAAEELLTAKTYSECQAAGATWVTNNFSGKDLIYIGQAGFDVSKLFINPAGASYHVDGASAGDYTLTGTTLRASADLTAAQEVILQAEKDGTTASINVVLGLSTTNIPIGGELIVYSIN